MQQLPEILKFYWGGGGVFYTATFRDPKVLLGGGGVFYAATFREPLSR